MARRRGRKNNDLMGKVIIAILLLLVLFGIFLVINTNINEPKIDKKTLCKKDKIYNKHIILVDITDKYNYIQINDIKSKVENIIQNIKKTEQVKVYFLEDKVDATIKPALIVCNPGKGEDKNYLYNNPTLLKQKWNENFYKPLSQTISKISSNKEFKYSPIIELIQLINILEFKNTKSTNRLTIISDMIQNSKEFSFFKDHLTFEKTKFADKYRTNMKNFDVNILLTRRDNLKHLQDKKHLQFWIDYFTKQHAVVSNIVRIDG